MTQYQVPNVEGVHPEVGMFAIEGSALVWDRWQKNVVSTSRGRTFKHQLRLYKAYRRKQRKYPAAAPGLSSHNVTSIQGSNAIDLSVRTTNAGLKAEILRFLGQLAKKRGLVWGGVWREADPVHFQRKVDTFKLAERWCDGVDCITGATSVEGN